MTRWHPFPDCDLRALRDLTGRADGKTARRLYLEIIEALEQRAQPQPRVTDIWAAARRAS